MTPRSIGQILVHRRSNGVAMGTLDGFFVMRVFGEATPEDIYATMTCHDIVLAVRPAGTMSIVALDPTSAFPCEETRRAAVEITRKTRPHTLGTVVIVLGDGFWASAFRGVLTTMNSLNQTTYPKAVVRYEREGVDWAIQTLGESPPKYRAALLDGLAELKPGSKVPRPLSTLRS
jgi:hypothetical protein